MLLRISLFPLIVRKRRIRRVVLKQKSRRRPPKAKTRRTTSNKRIQKASVFIAELMGTGRVIIISISSN